MRIVVTGGTGFIGQALVPYLVNHDLLLLTRTHPVPNGDIREPVKWREALADFAPEACIHLAWEGLPDYSEERCKSNVEASLSFAAALAETRCKNLVVAGSCWEYGQASGAVAESVNPENPGTFGAAKLELLRRLREQAPRLDLRWARIFFAYGPGQRSAALIPLCFRSMLLGQWPELREPNAVQDFIHVEDVARALVVLAESDIGPGIYNVASGSGTSSAKIAELVARAMGMPAECRSESHLRRGFWGNVDRLRAATGWRAEIAIERGVEMTVAALKKRALDRSYLDRRTLQS